MRNLLNITLGTVAILGFVEVAKLEVLLSVLKLNQGFLSSSFTVFLTFCSNGSFGRRL